MVEGAGGAPSVFDRGLTNIFDVALPVINNLDSFTAYILALPADQRPTSVAYATEDDPFTQPQIDKTKGLLEAAGLTTASYQVYPSETTDFNPIADKIIDSGAQVVVVGYIPARHRCLHPALQAAALQSSGYDCDIRSRQWRRFPQCNRWG